MEKIIPVYVDKLPFDISRKVKCIAFLLHCTKFSVVVLPEYLESSTGLKYVCKFCKMQ